MDDGRLQQISYLPVDKQVEILFEDLSLAAQRLLHVMPPTHPTRAAVATLSALGPPCPGSPPAPRGRRRGLLRRVK